MSSFAFFGGIEEQNIRSPGTISAEHISHGNVYLLIVHETLLSVVIIMQSKVCQSVGWSCWGRRTNQETERYLNVYLCDTFI